MGKKVTRIGVSIPENLLKRFDELISKRGYSSRSEGIRDAIRTYLLEYEWIDQEIGERVGVITVTYDHSLRGLTDIILDIQHTHSNLISATMHVHLGKTCMEVILVKGAVEKIRNVVDRLMALRGVKHVKLITTLTEEDI